MFQSNTCTINGTLTLQLTKKLSIVYSSIFYILINNIRGFYTAITQNPPYVLSTIKYIATYL